MAKVILCGYNWAGCMALKWLKNEKHETFVFTHENPPYINSLSDLCERDKIKYSFSPINKDNLPFKPDIICSVYYRNQIPPEVINACEKKIFNLHPSLLPKYRGCSSLTWAMIKGDKQAGFSFHYIDDKFDNGNIIIQKKLPIFEFGHVRIQRKQTKKWHCNIL